MWITSQISVYLVTFVYQRNQIKTNSSKRKINSTNKYLLKDNARKGCKSVSVYTLNKQIFSKNSPRLAYEFRLLKFIAYQKDLRSES